MSQFYQRGDREARPQKKSGRTGGGWFFPQITGKKRIALYGYSALTLLAAIIVVGYLVFELFSAPPVIPNVDTTRQPRPSSEMSEDPNDPNNPDMIDNPELSSDRKDRFYTFLLVGQSQEEGGSLTDTMMLAAYDVPNQVLKVMSLPRDIYVRRSNRRMLLNSVYNWGGGANGGKEALKEEVQKLTGVPVDFFVLVKWEAFGELVDAIGGVWYDVPRDMNYKDPEQNLYINVKKGYQLLDGDKAMQVVRFREGANGYIDGDLGRIRTQQGFMKEVVKKCLEPSTLLGNLGEYIEIFQKNVTTDLSVSNLTYFGKSAIGGLDMDNVEFITLPNKPAANGHLYPDANEILKVVNEGFNPYKEEIKPWEIKVESASTEDSPRATSTPKPSPTPTPDPSESPEPTGSASPAGSERPSASPDPSARPSDRPSEPSAGGEEEPPEISAAPTREPDAEESEPPVQVTDTPIFTPPTVPVAEPTPEPTPEEAPPELPGGPVG